MKGDFRQKVSMGLLRCYFFSFLFGVSIALWKLLYEMNHPLPLKIGSTVGGKGHTMPTGRSARHFVFFRPKMEDHGRMLLLIAWLSVALWVCHRQPNKKEINNPGTRKVVWNKATKNAQASLQRRAHIQRIYFAWPWLKKNNYLHITC